MNCHSFLNERVNVDKAEAKKVLDERFTLMRRIFKETPLALNVAYISWGEDALWGRLGWTRPVIKR
jgi:hypothetical protein